MPRFANHRRGTASSEAHSPAAEANLLAAAFLPPGLLENTLSREQLRHAPGTAAAVDEAVDAILSRLIPDLNRHLADLEGKSLGKEGNAEFAKSVTRLARRLGLEFACSCGQPAAALRYNATHGISVFKFEHTPIVRHGGPTTIPRLVLLPRDHNKT